MRRDKIDTRQVGTGTVHNDASIRSGSTGRRTALRESRFPDRADFSEPSLYGAPSAAADVDSGSAGRISFALAKDFAHDGCGISLAEEEVAQEVP